jgi:hypothetical protein
MAAERSKCNARVIGEDLASGLMEYGDGGFKDHWKFVIYRSLTTGQFSLIWIAAYNSHVYQSDPPPPLPHLRDNIKRV